MEIKKLRLMVKKEEDLQRQLQDASRKRDEETAKVQKEMQSVLNKINEEQSSRNQIK